MLWVLVGNLGYLLSSAVCSLLIWFSFRDFRTQSLSKVWRLLTTALSCILSPLSGHSRAERQRPLAQPCSSVPGPQRALVSAVGLGSVHRLFRTLSDCETSWSALFPFQPTLHFLHHPLLLPFPSFTSPHGAFLFRVTRSFSSPITCVFNQS